MCIKTSPPKKFEQILDGLDVDGLTKLGKVNPSFADLARDVINYKFTNNGDESLKGETV